MINIPRCKNHKQRPVYSKGKTKGLCKECYREDRREYDCAAGKKWRAANPEKVKKYRVERTASVKSYRLKERKHLWKRSLD